MGFRSPGWTRLVHLLVAAAAAAAAAAVLLLAAPCARTLEPPRPGELQKYRQDGTLGPRLVRARALGDFRIAPGLITGLKARAVQQVIGGPGRLLPPSALRGMPTTGNVRILTLLIDFDSYPGLNTPATIQSQLFGGGKPGDYPYESLTDYYERASYGQLNISGDVLGWYHAGPRTAIAQTTAGRETLIKQALQSYDPTHDFSQYDNDGDGVIDYLVVIWTGPNNGWANFWWGYQTSYGDQSVVLDGKTLNTYSWQWEYRYTGSPPASGPFDPIVVMHETGHALGLPDYYDYDSSVGPDGGVGGLAMMDANWGDQDGFSKWVLGWITPQVVSGAPQSVTLAPSGTDAQALVVMPGASSGDPFSEYFLVQNRQRVGNDSDCADIPSRDMPGDGLLIWHVDARLTSTPYGADFLYDNSYTSHKLLRLMEADGLNAIETSSVSAHASDYYKNGETFTATSNPDSTRYGGGASNVEVTGIGVPGTAMTFSAGVGSGGGADTTPPWVDVSGAGADWFYRVPTMLTFAATDEPGGSGVASVSYTYDGGIAVDTLGDTVGVLVPTLPNRRHTLTYWATDAAGNAGAPQAFAITMDTVGPRASGDDVIGRRGRLVPLRYRFADALSTSAWNVRVTVRNDRGATVNVMYPGRYHPKVIGRWYTAWWRPRRTGVYRYRVTGEDNAGNPQVRKGTGLIRVR